MLHLFATSVFPKSHFSVCPFAWLPLFDMACFPKMTRARMVLSNSKSYVLGFVTHLASQSALYMAWKMCFPDGFGGEKIRKRLRWWFEVQFFPLSMSLWKHDSSNCIIVHIWVGLVGDGSDFSPRGSFFFKLSGFPKVSKGQVTWKVDEMDSTKLELWPIETPEESPKWFPRNEMMSFSSHSP